MDALGLFSSGLFSGYTIIWAGGGYIESPSTDSSTVADGAFLIITSAYCQVSSGKSASLIGIIIIKNGSTAWGSGIGLDGSNMNGIGFDSITYRGTKVSLNAASSAAHLKWSGFIIA